MVTDERETSSEVAAAALHFNRFARDFRCGLHGQPAIDYLEASKKYAEVHGYRIGLALAYFAKNWDEAVANGYEVPKIGEE